MEYELTFVVSGASVDDDDAVDVLESELDAMLFRAGGVDLLTLSAVGGSAVEAAMEAATRAVAAVPRLRIHRLDRNLVGVHEVAQRSGRTRQNVSQWIRGERQADGAPFPLPEGTAGRSSVWLWCEVNAWLKTIGLDDGCVYPTREEMAVIDYTLMTATTLTFAFDAPSDAFSSERQQVQAGLEQLVPTGFLQHLAERATTTDKQGRHVVVLAAEREPAAQVMERLSGHGHDVVLLTMVDRLVAMVMSTNLPPQPTKLVSVPLDATMRDWVELMWTNPGAAFVLSSAGSRATTPIETVLRDSA